jgi:hypothetical protein
MSFRFDISVTRVECLHEQLNEWGKDEMHLFGFGVSRKGTLFATGYRNLGSYHEGDVKSGSQLAPPLFGADLAADGLEVLFYFWLVEEDGRGVGTPTSIAATASGSVRTPSRERTPATRTGTARGAEPASTRSRAVAGSTATTSATTTAASRPRAGALSSCATARSRTARTTRSPPATASVRS